MPSRILSKWEWLIFILSGFTLSLALFFSLIPQVPQGSVQGVSAPSVNNSVSPSEQKPVSLPAKKAGFGLPVRLKIPLINVDAAINYVGLAPDGSMDITESQEDVAWFKLGPRPGEIGSAVMAGHYGLRNKIGSVFDKLHKLQKGDKVDVEDDRGMITTFVVRESRNYDPKADASAVFGSNDDKSHLNLVTCEGVWSDAAKTFSMRLVVFTDKE